MNIISWNVCGLGDGSQRILKELCRSLHPPLLGIYEPRTKFSRISASFWQHLNLISVHQNERLNKRSNIWVFAAPSAQVSLIHSDQIVIVDYVHNNQVLCFGFIHGASTYLLRRQLWSVIITHMSSHSCFLGDFNAVLGAHEKNGGPPPPAISCREFADFIEAAALMEVPFKGRRFTWSGRRFFPRHVETALDRTLITPDFADLWASSITEVLPRNTSDHSPIVFRCTLAEASTPRPFRFLHMWTLHPDFMQLIQDEWSSPCSIRCPIYRVMHKLRQLKHKLKVWNKDIFGHLDSQQRDLHFKLDDVQDRISRLGYNEELFHEEVGIQADINDILAKQDSLARQKSRITWLKDGDRNTAFFHRMANYKRSRHLIPSLLIDGSLTSDPN